MFHFDNLDEALETLKAEEGPDYKGFEDRGSFGGKIAYGQTWEKLFNERHSKGSGPYGGLNNAVTRLVAVFRNRNLPYDQALLFAHAWNEKQCDPPIPKSELHNLFGQLWARLKPAEEEFSVNALADSEWEIWDADTLLDHCPDGLPWLIQNVFMTGGLHFLSAPPGGAKSWILLYLISCLKSGEKFFDRECPKRPILWIDEEMGGNIAADRARKIRMPRGPGLFYLGRQGVKLDNPKHLKNLIEMSEANPGLVIIIDTLIRVHSFAENDATAMAELYGLMKLILATDATIICAAHESGKMQMQTDAKSTVKHGRVRGSSEIIGMADMVYSVEKHEGYYRLLNVKDRLTADEDGLDVSFQLRDVDSPADGLGKRVDIAFITNEEAQEIELDAVEKTVKSALEYTVKYSVSEITEKTGVSNGPAQTALDGLCQKGEAVSEMDARTRRYRLAPTGF